MFKRGKRVWPSETEDASACALGKDSNEKQTGRPGGNEICNYRGVSMKWVCDFSQRVLQDQEAQGVSLIQTTKQIDDLPLESTGCIQEEDGDTLLIHFPFSGHKHLHRTQVKPKLRENWDIEDVCEYVVKSCKEVIHEKKLYLEKVQDVDIGPKLKGAFVSQARRTRWMDLVRALCEHFAGQDLANCFVWIDMFGANQGLLCGDDNVAMRKEYERLLSSGLHEAIRHFDECLVFFDSWRDPKPLKRAWCLWELGGAAKYRRGEQVAFEVIFAPAERERFVNDGLVNHFEDISAAISRMDLRKAECFNKEDKAMIHKEISTSIEGGYTTLNEMIAHQIRAWLTKTAKKAVNEAKLVYDQDASQWHKYAGLLQSAGTLVESEGVDMTAAKKMLEDAVGLWRKHCKHDRLDKQFAETLHGLASVELQLGNFDESLHHLNQALETLRALHQDNSTLFASALNSKATVLQQRGRFRDALEVYKQALELKENLLGPEDPSVARTLGNMGEIYSKGLGDLSKALEVLQRAYQIKKRSLGERHVSLAHTLHQLANLRSTLGQKEEARVLYKEALTIAKENGRHSAVSDLLNDIGNLLVVCEQYAEAEAHYIESLALKRKCLQPGHLSIAISLQNLASVYESQSRHKEALEKHKEAYNVKVQARGANHPSVATSLQNMAIVYQRLGDLDTALEMYNKAVEIKSVSCGKGHHSIADIHFNVSQLMLQQGRVEEARQLCTSVLEVYRSSFGESHARVKMAFELLQSLLEK